MDTAKRSKSPTRKTATKDAPRPRVASTARQRKQTTPTTEDIAKRAYEIFEARGGVDGDHTSDWLQAEQELLRPQPRPRLRKTTN